MLDVFRESVKTKIPEARFVEILVPAPPDDGRPWFVTANTMKLGIWLDFLRKTEEDTILIDCDMLAVRSPGEVFDKPFDVAITMKTQPSRFPFNAGVIFVRPNERSIRFFEKWQEWNNRMVSDSDLHRHFMRKYAGINQAALGALLESGDYGAAVERLPCRLYNATEKDYAFIDGNTCFIHVQGIFRLAVLADKPPIPRYDRVMREWYANSNSLL